MQLHRTALLLVCVLSSLVGCSSSGPRDPSEPLFSLALFPASPEQVTNPYFPLVPGTVHVYVLETADGVEINVVEVLETTRIVNGLRCAVVRDRVFEDDLMLEDALDWYAQDSAGNVWYMGEDVTAFEYDDEGNVIAEDKAGSWEAGLDVQGVGSIAEPGIIMKATLQRGNTYRQEFYHGEAEDSGEIVGLDVAVTLEDGTTHFCLQILGTNPLDPTAPPEYTYYARGIGMVAEEAIDGTDRSEMRGTFDVTLASLPDFGAATFSNPTNVTSTYLPWAAETVRTFLADDPDDPEKIVVERTDETRVVNGVECVVVRDRVYLGDLLIEDTFDWYAQDDQGNVWYMGEDTTAFEYDDDGNLIGMDHEGAWESGVDGALPGIIQYASPPIGRSYRQEYYEDEAEDMAVVVATGVTVTLSDGTTF